MTPKEKAISLVQSFIDEGFLPTAARIAALITIDEIINLYNELNINAFLKPNSIGFILNDIKNEIEKL